MTGAAESRLPAPTPTVVINRERRSFSRLREKVALAKQGSDEGSRRLKVLAGKAPTLCVEHRLIIELDGPPHESIEQKLHDASRDGELRRRGYHALRIANELVLAGGDFVLDEIRRAVAANESS